MEWRAIDFDSDGKETVEDGEQVTPLCLRLLAVKQLGYTHTEAGFALSGRLVDEYLEYCEMLNAGAKKDTINDLYD